MLTEVDLVVKLSTGFEREDKAHSGVSEHLLKSLPKCGYVRALVSKSTKHTCLASTVPYI